MVGFELAGMMERYIDACVQQTDANVVPSIMVWDAFHKSKLDIVDGPMNQRVYWWVLRQNILLCARDTFRNNFVLVQDNAPPHKAQATVNSSKIRTWRSWTGQPKALTWTLLGISGAR